MSNELVVAITGAIQESNFDEYKIQLLESIKGKDIALVTDADFDHAGEVVKACVDGEKAIKESKALAVAGMADVNKLFQAMDEISAELAKTRLSLSKKIKTEKVSQKQSAISAAEIFISDHVQSVDIDGFGFIASALCGDAKEAIEGSTSNRRSLDKIKEVTMDEAIKYVRMLHEFEEVVRINIAYLEEAAPDNMTLFHDKNRLLSMNNTTFREIVDTRMAGHAADLKAREMREKEEQRRREEYERSRKDNQEKRDEASIGKDLSDPKPLPSETVQAQRAGENWEITVGFSGEKADAAEAARMVRAVLEDTDGITSILLNRKQP